MNKRKQKASNKERKKETKLGRFTVTPLMVVTAVGAGCALLGLITVVVVVVLVLEEEEAAAAVVFVGVVVETTADDTGVVVVLGVGLEAAGAGRDAVAIDSLLR